MHERKGDSKRELYFYREENILSSPVESERVDDSEPSTSASGYASSAAETSTALRMLANSAKVKKRGLTLQYFNIGPYGGTSLITFGM